MGGGASKGPVRAGLARRATSPTPSSPPSPSTHSHPGSSARRQPGRLPSSPIPRPSSSPAPSQPSPSAPPHGAVSRPPRERRRQCHTAERSAPPVCARLRCRRAGSYEVTWPFCPSPHGWTRRSSRRSSSERQRGGATRKLALANSRLRVEKMKVTSPNIMTHPGSLTLPSLLPPTPPLPLAARR